MNYWAVRHHWGDLAGAQVIEYEEVNKSKNSVRHITVQSMSTGGLGLGFRLRRR